MAGIKTPAKNKPIADRIIQMKSITFIALLLLTISSSAQEYGSGGVTGVVIRHVSARKRMAEQTSEVMKHLRSGGS
jgi:hypothetical protein